MSHRLTRLLLSNETVAQTVLKNSFWLGVSQILSRLLRAVIVIYAARTLGANGYGVFSYALAIGGFLALFSDIGVNWILVREGAKNPHLRGKYLATTFFIKVTLLTVSCLLVLFAAPYFIKIEAAKVLLPWVGLLFLSDGLREFGFAVVRTMEKMEIEAGINIFTNFATVAIAITALIYHPSPYNLTVAYAIASVVGSVMAAYWLRQWLNRLAVDFSHQLIRPLIDAIWPFAATNLLWSVLTFTDTLMLGWIHTAEQVGWYAAAQRPVQLLLSLPFIVAASVLPSLSRFALTDNVKFKQLFERALALVMLITLPLVGGTWMMSQPLTLLLYGPDYLATATVLRILSIGFLITFPWVVVTNAIFAQNLQKAFLPHMLFGAISNIILNWFMIPQWGATGAAVATVISQLAAYGWIFLVIRRRNQLVVVPHIYRMVIATVAMMGLIWLMQLWQTNFYITVGSAVVGYGLGLWITREPLLKQLGQIWRGAESAKN